MTKLRLTYAFLMALAGSAVLWAQETELPTTSEEQLVVIAPALVMMANALILIGAGFLLKKVWPAVKAKKPVVVQVVVVVLGMLLPLAESAFPASLAGIDLSPLLQSIEQAGTAIAAGSGAAAIGVFHVAKENKRKG